jgi:hypothetical protein
MKSKRAFLVFTLFLLTACGSTTQIIPVPTVKPTEPPAAETPLMEREPVPDGGEKAEPAPENAPQPEREPDAAPPEPDVYTPGDTDIGINAENGKLPVYIYKISSDGDQALEYLNEFLDKNGFGLEFRFFEVVAGTKNEERLQKQFIDDNIHENVVFMPRSLPD